MFMPISHPWLARPSLRFGRRRGGTQTREQRSPSWCAARAAALALLRDRLRQRRPSICLSASELQPLISRGVFCRACVQRQPGTTVERGPGRERPPLPPPEGGPEPCREGVAHAPAACLVHPDRRDRALAV